MDRSVFGAFPLGFAGPRSQEGRYASPLVPLSSSILEVAFDDPQDSGASLGPSSSRSLAAILGIRTPARLGRSGTAAHR